MFNCKTTPGHDDNPMARALMSERRTALLTMIAPFSTSAYTPAMPELVSAFGTTDAAIKMTMSPYFGGFANPYPEMQRERHFSDR